MRNFFLSLLLLDLIGCSERVVRSNYHLDHYGDIVVTDSPTQLLQPKRLKDGEIEVKQSLIIESTSTKSVRVVRLDHAKFIVNGEIETARCTDSQAREGALSITPGAKNRIDCSVRIHANNANKLLTKDSVGVLQIPIDGMDRSMEFKFALKLEDFES